MNNSFEASYFGELRPEVIEMVPVDATSILDVGCGYGLLGRALKDRGARSVCGIELSSRAAGEAKKVLDVVFEGSVETTTLPFNRGQFDCIICADVLEHLVDPWSVLCMLKQYLNSNGCIVASIPNVGFHRVVRGLIKGHWDYTDSGVLDKTHLRFFTLEGIVKLFAQNQFKVDMIYKKIDSGLNMKLLNCFLFGMIKESLVIQYIIRATPLISDGRE